MVDLVSALFGFLGDPTFGLPLAIVGGLLAGWLFANLSGGAPPLPTRTTWQRPDQDAVSQTFYAAEDGLHSRLVQAAYDRLDRSLASRYAVHLGGLGWRPWPTPARDVPGRKELLRLGERLSRRFSEAVQRELPSRIHWAFWRDPAVDVELFVARVADAVHDARLMVQNLERTS